MHNDHRDISEPAHFRHLIKTGIVSAIEADSAGRPFARIVYPDRQGITTAPFPILQRNTVGTVDHSCPRVGEMAVVIHLGTGLEQGIVLGCIHTDKVTPCVTDGTLVKRKVTFDDGSIVQFDPTTKVLTVNTNGDVDVTTATNVNVVATGNLSATIGGTVQITSTGNTTITAPQIHLVGDVYVDNNMKLWVDNIKGNLQPFPTATPKVVNADASGGGS